MTVQSPTAQLERRPLSLAAVRVPAATLAGFAIVALALVIRLVGHTTNYDIFIDEITYATLGREVAQGHGVVLYGSAFFLHTPAFFSLEGGLMQLFGGARSTLGLVLDLRLINCVLGAIECGLVMLLVGKLTNRWLALAAGLFVAVDPFLLLWDGRVTLETMAMTSALAGWLFVVALADAPGTPWAGREQPALPQWQAIFLGGCMFGISLLTNETYAFVGVVPLAVLVVLGSPLSRKRSGAMLGVAALCWIAYWLSIVASGQLKAWWSQQSSGLQRAAGTKQISGFNQTGHATFTSRIAADLHLYGVSYLVVASIALVTAVWVVLWFRAARAGRPLGPRRRLAIVLSACALFYVLFAGLRGAFEEQIFYMCMMAGVPLLAVSADALWTRYRSRAGRPALLVAGLLCLAALGFELAVDVHVRSTRDTDFPRLVSYVDRHVHYPSLVDSTDGLTQFLIQGERLEVALTMGQVRRHPPRYVVVASSLVRQGYVKFGPGFERWLTRHGQVVFRAHDATTGQLLLYRVGAWPGRRGTSHRRRAR